MSKTRNYLTQIIHLGRINFRRVITESYIYVYIYAHKYILKKKITVCYHEIRKLLHFLNINLLPSQETIGILEILHLIVTWYVRQTW